ncbi:MAG: hypothetical protein LBG13_02100 [Holosporales bacterium]|jgi:hypothetical protein|nr:hypothetical protein [Holosporales bacterium]
MDAKNISKSVLNVVCKGVGMLCRYLYYTVSGVGGVIMIILLLLICLVDPLLSFIETFVTLIMLWLN